MPRPFHFKQFSLYHHRSTMKTGTDAVLLSAWVDISNINNALDVGTGSGIIALMMAARGIKNVDAIEPDKDSAEEAGENFKNSPFQNKPEIYKDDFVSFAKNYNNKYDLIISNPPFFINDMRSKNKKKRQARHTDSLSYSDLIINSYKLLDKEGKLCIVLPYYESHFFTRISLDAGFHISRKLLIFPKPCKEPNRINIELSKTKPGKVVIEKFIIRNEHSGYTKQYINLLSNYYTKISDK